MNTICETIYGVASDCLFEIRMVNSEKILNMKGLTRKFKNFINYFDNPN